MNRCKIAVNLFAQLCVCVPKRGRKKEQTVLFFAQFVCSKGLAFQSGFIFTLQTYFEFCT